MRSETMMRQVWTRNRDCQNVNPADSSITGPRTDPVEHGRAIVAKVERQFTYARSVPEHPHEYLVRDRLADDLKLEFDALLALIDAHGQDGQFRGHRWRYLSIDQWTYWASRSWYSPGPIINRRHEVAR
jgi:hypothetical protein